MRCPRPAPRAKSCASLWRRAPVIPGVCCRREAPIKAPKSPGLPRQVHGRVATCSDPETVGRRSSFVCHPWKFIPWTGKLPFPARFGFPQNPYSVDRKPSTKNLELLRLEKIIGPVFYNLHLRNRRSVAIRKCLETGPPSPLKELDYLAVCEPGIRQNRNSSFLLDLHLRHIEGGLRVFHLEAFQRSYQDLRNDSVS